VFPMLGRHAQSSPPSRRNSTPTIFCKSGLLFEEREPVKGALGMHAWPCCSLSFSFCFCCAAASFLFCSFTFCSAFFSTANCLSFTNIKTHAFTLSFYCLLSLLAHLLFLCFLFCSSRSTILTWPWSAAILDLSWEIHTKRTGS
jgi:hypothetical protein